MESRAILQRMRVNKKIGANNVKILFFGFFICFLAAVTPSFSQNQISLISYNTYNGFQSDTSMMEQYLDWIKEKDPDIVAYQEMNHFTQKGLEEFAAQYVHDYAVIIKEEGYPVAVSSKYPIINVQKITDNMHHG